MKLMLIDGNSIVNRAFFGIRELNAPDGERYTDHNPMLTEFSYTRTGSLAAPETLTEPTAPNKALLTVKEILWTVVRVFQVVIGLVELPYLIVQGVDLLINGKMP